jgi:hypothetical protein
MYAAPCAVYQLNKPNRLISPYQGVEKQASGRQPRRAAFWKAQHIHNM